MDDLTRRYADRHLDIERLLLGDLDNWRPTGFLGAYREATATPADALRDAYVELGDPYGWTARSGPALLCPDRPGGPALAPFTQLSVQVRDWVPPGRAIVATADVAADLDRAAAMIEDSFAPSGRTDWLDILALARRDQGLDGYQPIATVVVGDAERTGHDDGPIAAVVQIQRAVALRQEALRTEHDFGLHHAVEHADCPLCSWLGPGPTGD